MRPWIFFRIRNDFFQVYDDGIEPENPISNLEYSILDQSNLDRKKGLIGTLKKIKDKTYLRIGLAVKVTDIFESDYRKYINFSKKINRRVICFGKNKIEQYIDLVEIKNKIVNNEINLNEVVLKDFNYLLNTLTSADVDTSNLGVEGSLLMNLENENSDFDLVIYGSEKYLDFLSKFQKLEDPTGNIERFSVSDFGRRTIFNARKHYSILSEEEMVFHESRRPTGFINLSGKNRKFSIVGIIDQNEDLRKEMNNKFLLDSSFSKIGFITISAEVQSDTYAVFRPSFYPVKNVNILNKSFNLNIDCSKIKYIVDYIGNSYLQCKNGEKN